MTVVQCSSLFEREVDVPCLLSFLDGFQFFWCPIWYPYSAYFLEDE